jgi:hypothetical protein
MTTLFTRPMRRASEVSVISPVITSSVAFAKPTIRRRRNIPPSAGTQPRLIQTSPKRARSEAIRKSQATVISHPAPMAAPRAVQSNHFAPLFLERELFSPAPEGAYAGSWTATSRRGTA